MTFDGGAVLERADEQKVVPSLTVAASVPSLIGFVVGLAQNHTAAPLPQEGHWAVRLPYNSRACSSYR